MKTICDKFFLTQNVILHNIYTLKNLAAQKELHDEETKRFNDCKLSNAFPSVLLK